MFEGVEWSVGGHLRRRIRGRLIPRIARVVARLKIAIGLANTRCGLTYDNPAIGAGIGPLSDRKRGGAVGRRHGRGVASAVINKRSAHAGHVGDVGHHVAKTRRVTRDAEGGRPSELVRHAPDTVFEVNVVRQVIERERMAVPINDVL